jgi:hypothetical protein
MPRQPRPWYRKQTGWWMAQLDQRKVKLIEGRKEQGSRCRQQVGSGYAQAVHQNDRRSIRRRID